jgi:hypothetical protein
LYGKKPVANTKMAAGIRRLAASSNTELRVPSRPRRAVISTGELAKEIAGEHQCGKSPIVVRTRP